MPRHERRLGGGTAPSGRRSAPPVCATCGRPGFLVLRSGALGDFVLTLPVLSGVRRLFAQAEITLATKTSYCRLAVASGLADTVIPEDSPEIVRLYAESAESGRTLRERHGVFDIALSFVPSGHVRRNLLAAGVGTLLCRAPRPDRYSSLHAADHLLAVLRSFGRLTCPAVPHLGLGDKDRREAEAFLREEGLEPGKYLALHPGSGSPAKNWPLERFAEAARRVRKELGLEVVVITGPAEEERRAEIDRAFGAARDASLHSADLVRLAGVLGTSAAYLGNDSGVTHLAAAAGANVVAVFGPSDPDVWAPRGERVHLLRHGSGDIGAVDVEEVMSVLR